MRFLPPRDILLDVYVGTPPQKFTVLLDTGSSDLWIPHHKIQSIASETQSSKFKPSSSSTWTASRPEWAVHYRDTTIAEGIQGIEQVRIGECVIDARVGVAEKITQEVAGERVQIGRILGIKAGRKGYEGLDGILGAGLGSSVVVGLREAGVRGFKLSFNEKGGGGMEMLTDTDAEKGLVWYNVEKKVHDAAWEIPLRNVDFENQSIPVIPRSKIMFDTGSVHHYLPSLIAKTLFHQSTLFLKYLEIIFVPTLGAKMDNSEAGWKLSSPPAPREPVYLQFVGRKKRWPVNLESPINDEFASIRSPAPKHRAVLGMPFISRQEGIIFDFSKGKERIGIITSEMNEEDTFDEGMRYGNHPRDRIVQLIVGAGLGLGIAAGWKWYEGTLFNNNTN